jgi:hypothetical protein
MQWFASHLQPSETQDLATSYVTVPFSDSLDSLPSSEQQTPDLSPRSSPATTPGSIDHKYLGSGLLTPPDLLTPIDEGKVMSHGGTPFVGDDLSKITLITLNSTETSLGKGRGVEVVKIVEDDEERST